VWYDRDGTEVGRAPISGLNAAAPSLSPDGKRVLFRRTDAQSRSLLWLDDLERNQEIQLTNVPGGAAVWSPDGQRMAFVHGGDAPGDRGIYVRNVSGGDEQLVMRQGENTVSVSDWSRDGRWLAYTEADPKTGNGDIWALPLNGNPTTSKPVLLLRTPDLE